MTATQGVLALNSQLKIGDGMTPQVYTLIPDIFDNIDGPEVAQQYVDFTHMQSTGGFEERKASFKSPGNVTFSCHYVKDNAQHEALVNAAVANPTTLKDFQLLYPDGTLIEFSAYPSVKFSAATKGKFVMQVTLGLEGSFALT